MDHQNSSLEDRLRQRAAEQTTQRADSWKPEIGDQLVGLIVGFDSARTKFDKTARIVIVEDAKGVRHGVWLAGRVISEEFDRSGADIGDGILFERLEDGGDGRYKRFRVIADRDDSGAR